MEQIRDAWTDEQAVEDIQRQIQGLGFSKPSAADTAYLPQRPAQKRLLEALTAPVDDSLEGYYRRRAKLIDAIVVYCSVVEGRTAPRTNTAAVSKSATSPGLRPPTEDPLEAAMLSVFIKHEKERPRRCFLCIGAALSLKANDPRLEELTHEFYTSGNLTKHLC
jgi:hypothetical protein